MEENRTTVERRLCSGLRREWDNKKKRFAIARIAKVVVDECWNYVGAESNKWCVVTVLPADGDAFATIESRRTTDTWSIDLPVSAVGAWLARAIPHVGCDPDMVAKTLATRMWRAYQFMNEPKPTPVVVKKPLSLFDYCHETILTSRAAVR